MELNEEWFSYAQQNIDLTRYLPEKLVIHSNRVSDLAVKLATILGFDEKKKNRCKLIGLYHEIGKSKLPINMVINDCKLTPFEMRVFKKYPFYSFDHLLDTGFDVDFLRITLLHKERYDGSGYPFGMKASKIPLESQIVGLCDYVDHMHNIKRITCLELISHLLEIRNKLFCDKVVDSMIQLFLA